MTNDRRVKFSRNNINEIGILKTVNTETKVNITAKINKFFSRT